MNKFIKYEEFECNRRKYWKRMNELNSWTAGNEDRTNDHSDIIPQNNIEGKRKK